MIQPPLRFKTISQFHAVHQLPPPQHPSLSLIDVTGRTPPPNEPVSFVFDFYAIALKSVSSGQVKYGQQPFDFDSGMMGFSAPGQVISLALNQEQALEQAGWLLLVHPDFLWNTPLAKKIRQYAFFSYAVNEALFVSESEKAVLTSILVAMNQETYRPIDPFSQEIIVAQLATLLAYSERFYRRQFITRQPASHQLHDRLNALLDEHFESEAMTTQGLPSVSFLAEQLHVSPHYLSSLLRSLTGLNTQQHIHLKLIEKAKELLSTTSLRVGEIAYRLGFEQLQSFSKLFRTKTNLSPVNFRRSFT